MASLLGNRTSSLCSTLMNLGSLLPSFDLSTLSTSVTIPSSIGPSGAYYALAFLPVSLSNPQWPYSLPEYSPFFFLANATSAFSSYEVPDRTDQPLSWAFAEYSFSTAADIPCTAYDCVRQCAGKQAPTQQAWANDTVWTNCLATCPGVEIDPSKQSSVLAATTLFGGTQTVETPLATPTSACSTGQYNTPCNGSCCHSGDYCQLWNGCVAMDSSITASPTTQSASATSSSNAMPVTAAGSRYLAGAGILAAIMYNI